MLVGQNAVKSLELCKARPPGHNPHAVQFNVGIFFAETKVKNNKANVEFLVFALTAVEVFWDTC